MPEVGQRLSKVKKVQTVQISLEIGKVPHLRAFSFQKAASSVAVAAPPVDMQTAASPVLPPAPPAPTTIHLRPSCLHLRLKIPVRAFSVSFVRSCFFMLLRIPRVLWARKSVNFIRVDSWLKIGSNLNRIAYIVTR